MMIKHTKQNSVLSVPHISLQLLQQPTYALNKIHYFMTSIKPLYVLEQGCHTWGVFLEKRIQAQHANLGTALPFLERLKR